MNRREIERAIQAGESARRSGKRLADNPWRNAHTPDGRLLAENWEEGWRRADQARRR